MLVKIYKYRVLILQVILLTLKFRFFQFFLPKQHFFNKLVEIKDKQLINRPLINNLQPKAKLIGLTEKILDWIVPGSGCLLRAFIKREVLYRHGYNVGINLGVSFEENKLKAHAWLPGEKIEHYIKVYQMP